MNLLVVMVLAWLILFGWVMGLWLFSSFDVAWNHLELLATQQTTVLHWATPHKITAITEALHEEMTIALPEVTLFNLPAFTLEFQDALQITKQVWLLMQLTTQVMLIKLMGLFLALPLFALTMTAGLVDGLNQRFIRTASLGRESSYMFHRLNHYFKRGLLVLLMVWLAIPISITPVLMFVPISILLGLMVSITASRFKKYL